MIKKTDIPNDTVSYAKMQNAEADNVVIGNVSGAGEPVKELSASELAGIVDGELLIDEDDFASDTDTKAPTQQSTKAYVDNAVVQPDVVLVETQTASSSSSIDFTTLSTDYAFFKFVLMAVVPATDGTIMTILTSSDGGSSYDNSSADYNFIQMLGINNTNSTFTGNSTRIPVHAGSAGSASNEELQAEVTLYNPAGTGYTHVRSDAAVIDSSGNRVWSSITGARLSAADVDALRFIMDSGNIASGTFKLYGYK
jgi:hypothetical protein